jgi:hypothetical protein
LGCDALESRTPLDGINVTRRFQRILQTAGLPRQRFPALRHAAASLLLAQSVAMWPAGLRKI